MSGRRSKDDGHGLSAAEETIVSRLEAGESHGVVARSLGLSLATIVVTGRRYIIGEKQLNGFADQCRRSEGRYRASLVATGKVYL